MASREMTPEEFRRYHDAIRAANASGDREALRSILRELISRWGPGGTAVIALLREMRFSK